MKKNRNCLENFLTRLQSIMFVILRNKKKVSHYKQGKENFLLTKILIFFIKKFLELKKNLDMSWLQYLPCHPKTAEARRNQ